jgi:3-isopropylmalate/(R)-2-methylmalate dehydratase small subunit
MGANKAAMAKSFNGPVLFLDKSDINTDEIIPAKYLTEIEKEALKPHLLEDLKLEGFDCNGEELKKASIIVSRKNFGCGSSREHAPWALEVNGIHVVIAENFARIFRQNMFNGGMLAIELDPETLDSVFALRKYGAVNCAADLPNKTLLFSTENGESLSVKFSLMEFDKTLVQAGGWLEFADRNY